MCGGGQTLSHCAAQAAQPGGLCCPHAHVQLPRTRTHAHTHTHTHARTHTHVQLPRTRTHTRTHTHAHAQPHLLGTRHPLSPHLCVDGGGVRLAGISQVGERCLPLRLPGSLFFLLNGLLQIGCIPAPHGQPGNGRAAACCAWEAAGCWAALLQRHLDTAAASAAQQAWLATREASTSPIGKLSCIGRNWALRTLTCQA